MLFERCFKGNSNKTLSQHYAVFNKVCESIISYHTRCEKDAEAIGPIMLTFLRNPPSKFIHASLQVTKSSAFESLPKILTSPKCLHKKKQQSSWNQSYERLTLVVQQGQFVAPRGQEGDFGGRDFDRDFGHRGRSGSIGDFG